MEDLNFRGVGYGKLFQELQAELPAGRRIGLTGPNGCGKTTLLRLLAGWLPWQSGQLFIGSQDQLALPPEKRQLTFLPSQAALFSHWTVRQNIAFPARSLGVADRSATLIQQLQLESLAERKPGRLSQGERQRVAWARLLNRPAHWLLADEALAHLDGPQRHQLWQLLGQRSLLLVTHQLQLDLPWLDQLWVLEGGHLHRLDLEELEKNPRSAWLAGQLHPENVWSGELLGWPAGAWWIPASAWKDDREGWETRWLEARGPLWKVEVRGRTFWLEREAAGSKLKPERQAATLLNPSNEP
ncbi:MAG: ATP-binding cassette domain-containing protein [Candidatus Eremiobacteraeota bacterium]|nr:ATP-binding cassette domain-containing protein [Candidatus Eremiobacteraeota bacterium]MCW5870656.1 ATP-binding cassette domain-containing protein [Candidatus Eremiobacteraeota bacterium]